jgi:hypothetical protein
MTELAKGGGIDVSATIEAEGTAHPKLPLWETIALSYSTYFRDFGTALQISWPWLLLIAPLTAASTWLQTSWMAEAVANMKSGAPPRMPTEAAVLGNVSTVVMLFAGVSIAVAWHRHLLLNEAPGFGASNVVTRSLWRYIGMGLAIGLIAGLPALLIIVPVFLWAVPLATGANAAAAGPTIFPIVLVVFIVYFVALAVMLRLSLLLPARAIGDLTLTFKEALNRTRGNTWRIFWGIVVCTLPPLLAAEIAFLVLVGFPNPVSLAEGAMLAQWIIASVVFAGYYLSVLPISIGFLSHAYRHFFGRAQTDNALHS